MLAITELLRRHRRIFLEDPCEVALVTEVELLRDLRDPFVRMAQVILGLFDPAHIQVLHQCDACVLSEDTRQMARRNVEMLCDFFHRQIAFHFIIDEHDNFIDRLVAK